MKRIYWIVASVIAGASYLYSVIEELGPGKLASELPTLILGIFFVVVVFDAIVAGAAWLLGRLRNKPGVGTLIVSSSLPSLCEFSAS